GPALQDLKVDLWVQLHRGNIPRVAEAPMGHNLKRSVNAGEPQHAQVVLPQLHCPIQESGTEYIEISGAKNRLIDLVEQGQVLITFLGAISAGRELLSELAELGLGENATLDVSPERGCEECDQQLDANEPDQITHRERRLDAKGVGRVDEHVIERDRAH